MKTISGFLIKDSGEATFGSEMPVISGTVQGIDLTDTTIKAGGSAIIGDTKITAVTDSVVTFSTEGLTITSGEVTVYDLSSESVGVTIASLEVDGILNISKNCDLTATTLVEESTGCISVEAGASLTIETDVIIGSEDEGKIILTEGKIAMFYGDEPGVSFTGTEGLATLNDEDILTGGYTEIGEGFTLAVNTGITFVIPAGIEVQVDGSVIPTTTETEYFTNNGTITLGDKGTLGSPTEKFGSSTQKGKIVNGITSGDEQNVFVNTTKDVITADVPTGWDIDADVIKQIATNDVDVGATTVAALKNLEIQPETAVTFTDGITLEGAGAVLYINGNGGVNGTVNLGTYSVKLTAVKGTFGIAYGSTELYGTITSGTVEIVSADEAYLISDLTIKSGATLQIDAGVELELRNKILNNSGTISGEGTIIVSDEDYKDGAFNNSGTVASTITIEYYDSGEETIEVSTGAAFVNAVKSGLYDRIILTDSIELTSDVLVQDLELSQITVDIGEYIFTLDSNVDLTFKTAKINSNGGYVYVKNGNLINNDSDLYTNVLIDDENGSVDNSKAKTQYATGSSFENDVKVGYGNTLVIDNYSITYNTDAIVYGTMIVNGNSSVAKGSFLTVYGTLDVRGTLNVAGTLIDNGKTTVSGTVSINGSTESGVDYDATLIIDPREADGTQIGAFDYDADDYGFQIASTGTLVVQNPSKTYDNVMIVCQTGYNVLRVDGTLRMNGTMFTIDGNNGESASITDAGTVIINGTVLDMGADVSAYTEAIGYDFPSTTPYRTQVDLMDGNSFTLTSVKGTVYVSDYFVCEVESQDVQSAGTYFGGISAENLITLTNVKGLTVTEAMTITTNSDTNKKYYYGNLNISGAVVNIDTNDYTGYVYIAGTETAAYGAYGSVNVAGDVTLGEKVRMYFSAGKNLNVNADATLSSLQKNDVLSLEADAVLTVSGMIRTGGAENRTFTIVGTLNAAEYRITDSEAITYIYYTTIDAALAMISSADEKIVYAYGSTTASSDFTIADDQTLTFEDDAVVTVKGTSIVKAGAEVSGSGYFKVSGILTIEDINDYSGDAIDADVVFDKDPTFIYTSLKNAVVMPGVTDVVLNKNVTVSSDLVIPEGVQVYSEKYNITVSAGKVLTVNGGIVLTKGTVNLTIGSKASVAPASMVVNGYVIVKTVEDSSGEGKYSGLEYIKGAHYQAKYEGTKKFFITSLAYAGENFTAGNMEITVYGVVTENEKVSFTNTQSASDYIIKISPYKVWSWNATAKQWVQTDADSSVTLNQGMYLEGVDLYLNQTAEGKHGYLTGTIAAPAADGIAQITLTNVKGIMIEADSTSSTDRLLITGAQDGKLAIDDGLVTLSSDDYTVGADDTFVIGSDGVLSIPEGAVLAQDVKADIEIAGIMNISGSGAKFEQNGETEVTGIINVENFGILDVNGTMCLEDGATVMVDATLGKEGSFTVDGILAVGSKTADISAGAVIDGIVNITTNGAYIKVYGSSTIDTIQFNGSESNVVSSTFYVRNVDIGGSDVRYMDVYAGTDKVEAYDVIMAEVFAIKGVNNGIADLKTGLYTELKADVLKYWFTSTDMTEDQCVKNGGQKIGEYSAYFAKAYASDVKVTIYVGAGLYLYIDGKGYSTTSGVPEILTVGTHTLAYELHAGYDGDNVTLTFNGKAVPVTASGAIIDVTYGMDDCTLQITGAVPHVDPPAPTPEKESEWTVTTILLCILVVLIAIMAVIVALRLNRN
ncbi:MAG: hypothetical protein IJ248_09000 [Candidatus Methanomethylophilaceae archaeon]|nr:hypothetical protein [Candidatus Methanomethylophilaceae archaeon]